MKNLDFTCYFEWKELLVVESNLGKIKFDSPGLKGNCVYIPSAKVWKDHVPFWARELRENILCSIRMTFVSIEINEVDDAWGYDN